MLTPIRSDNGIGDRDALANDDTRCELSEEHVLANIDGATMRALEFIERLETLDNIRPLCQLLAG